MPHKEPSMNINLLGKEVYSELERDPNQELLSIILQKFGSVFQCDRVYICERKKNGTFDNTYEWCAPGVISEFDMLQNDDASNYNYWYEQFSAGDGCIIQSVEELRENEPSLYHRLAKRNVRELVVCSITLRGMDYGFIAADNPNIDFSFVKECMMGMRIFIAEALFSRDLRNSLRDSGFLDRLTNAGNRMALNDVLSRIEKGHPIGFLVVDILNLKGINDTEGHHVGDSILKQLTAILNAEFGPNYVFRIGGGEFLCMYLEETDANLHRIEAAVRQKLKEEQIRAVTVCSYENPWKTDFDTLMRRMDLRLLEEKRVYRQGNFKERNVSSQEFERTVLQANLITHKVKPVYLSSDINNPVPEMDISDMTERRMKNIHPDDQNEYRTFWNEAEITSGFKRKPYERRSVVYRLKRNDLWVWTEERMELVVRTEQDNRVLVTVSTGSSMPPYNPIHDGNIEEARHAKASLVMYRNADFFHHAAVWRSQNEANSFMMLAFDINHFKLYNSMFGREAGNRLLEMVQTSMLRVSRQYHGISGYMGNDNFALLVPRHGKPLEESIQIIHREISELHIPTLFEPSIGVYLCENSDELPREQYEWALLAAEEASDNLNDHVYVFDRQRYEKRRDEQLLLLDAEDGLRKKEFTFYLQPKVNMRNGRLISFEALVRWKRGGETISPVVFVEPMEKAGMIHSLDMSVLNDVCEWLKARIDQNLPVIPVSVNLSRADFSDEAISKEVEQTVASYGIDPSLIQIEITESAFYDDDNRIRNCLDSLRGRGHRILLDDFGKGYSALNSLHTMNLDVLKLDKQFIDALDNEEDRRIVETVIRMAHMIGMLVIAEGVETAGQRDLLMKLNCYYCQGYYFYRPMPKEEAWDLINNEDLIQEELPFTAGLRFGQLSFAELIDEKLLSSEQINAIIGPIAIFEMTKDTVHILQLNDAYAKIIGVDVDDTEGRESVLDQMDESMSRIRSNFLIADEHPGATSRSGFMRSDGERVDLEAAIYPISKTEDASFYLVVLKLLSAELQN